MDFYVLDNSNNCVVAGLRDETGAFVDDADLTLVVYGRDAEGLLVEVMNEGGSDPNWPFSFVAEGRGFYRCHLPPTLNMVPGVEYQAEIEGTAGSRHFKESRRLFAKSRLTK